MLQTRDHGGGLDAAIAQYGGDRADWIDLSTGINPNPYPLPPLTPEAWTALPDVLAQRNLAQTARHFWNVPDDAAILATPGLSSVIAQIPRLASPGSVRIPAPTYNEHAASFSAHGWSVTTTAQADACVFVHPNNPDGRCWTESDLDTALTVIDESFCDVVPDRSLVATSTRTGTLVLKSFGKFWGLAGLRLGFVIGSRAHIDRLADMLGPWPVSGIALEVGAAALQDTAWADATRARLSRDADRLDAMVTIKGAKLVGGTPLFRLYDVDDAAAWQDRLARAHIWSRIFPYSKTWLRLGLPGERHWDRLEAAL